MAEFRTKPATVEARQWDTGSRAQANELIAWIQSGKMQAFFDTSQFPDAVYLVIVTRNGQLYASPPNPDEEGLAAEGDWIVRGAGGEFSVYKPDVFPLTFDPA
jgi:hypothetical protein